MKTNSIGSINASQKGTAVGKAAGFCAGSAYIIKNRKDIFEKGIGTGIKQLENAGKTISKNKATAIAGGVGVLFIGAATAAGALIGKGIGKLVDNHNKKKEDVKFLRQNSKIVDAKLGEHTDINMKNVNKIMKKLNEGIKK